MWRPGIRFLLIAALAATVAGCGSTVRGIIRGRGQHPAPDCGGQRAPAGAAGGGWVCTFDDEFDASTGDASRLDRSVWSPQVTSDSGFLSGVAPTTAADNDTACYEDTPRTVSVARGTLDLSLRVTPAPFTCAGRFGTRFAAGMVSTVRSFTQRYGLFEVRAKLPGVSSPGLQETFWLYPHRQTYGSASGEIDFSEFYSAYPQLDIPVFHYPAAAAGSAGADRPTAHCPIQLGKFHTYLLRWSPGLLTVLIDGRSCLVDRYAPGGGLHSPQPFDQPFFLALTQALGAAADAPSIGAGAGTATTQVDYVRAWEHG